MRIHEGFPVIDGFFNIVHVRNPGAAFGFLAGASPAVPVGFFHRGDRGGDPPHPPVPPEGPDRGAFAGLALALILAGAVGNLIDRVRFGEVVDFLDVYIGTYHWPAFNVADSAITVGAILLAMILLRRRKEGQRRGRPLPEDDRGVDGGRPPARRRSAD